MIAFYVDGKKAQEFRCCMGFSPKMVAASPVNAVVFKMYCVNSCLGPESFSAYTLRTTLNSIQILIAGVSRYSVSIMK